MTHSPTVIYHATSNDNDKIAMVIDIGGNYYVQVYQVYTPGNLHLIESEIWSDAMSAKRTARTLLNNLGG